MRGWMRWLPVVAVLGIGAGLLFPRSRGQDRVATLPAAAAAAAPAEPDLSKLPPLVRQMHLSAMRGADWLARANRSDGHFDYGYIPALKTLIDGDNYLRQAGAAAALAREARFMHNERHAAVARQALLTLLLETAPDAQDARLRYTSLPSVVVNRVAAAGLLVLAISELPAPGDDLLQQSEQLCLFLARQQRPDGSLCLTDNTDAPGPAGSPEEGASYAGAAVYGLMRSQLHCPAAWKTEVVRKALPYYLADWRGHRSTAAVPWQVAAYTEAYLRTREPAFAGAVNEMADWLCGLQYVQLDPRHPLWVGGFMSWADNRPAATEPQVGSAACAEALAEACRVARQAGDLQHYQRFREALERCLQFLTTLQYTDANTQHFADWYRPVVLGGFHASHQDGTLRIDYTQHAVGALVQYLNYVAE